jgi:hypothetical protein
MRGRPATAARRDSACATTPTAHRAVRALTAGGAPRLTVATTAVVSLLQNRKEKKRRQTAWYFTPKAIRNPPSRGRRKEPQKKARIFFSVCQLSRATTGRRRRRGTESPPLPARYVCASVPPFPLSATARSAAAGRCGRRRGGGATFSPRFSGRVLYAARRPGLAAFA